MNNIIDLNIQLYLLYIKNNKQTYYNVNIVVGSLFTTYTKRAVESLYALYWSKKLIFHHPQFIVLDRVEVISIIISEWSS